MRYLIIILSLFMFGELFAVDFVPEQPSLSTKAFILVDYDSGKVLLEKNSEQKLEPASLTKIMTMYVVDHEIKEGRLSLNDEITVSKQAWQTMGSRMFLDVNSKVKVSDVIKGIIIQSGNDASVAIAEHIAGSEQAFAHLMNDYAATLGMNNSHFTNATGLPDPDHYTTTQDLATLAMASIKEHPASYTIYSQKSFVYNNIEQNNRNKLLWRNSVVDGIKTGQTDNAGYCLAVSGVKDNTRLIAILLGAKTDEVRTTDANKLLTWGFRFFASHKIYQHDKILETARIWGGSNKTIDIGLSQDVYLSLLKNDINKLTASLNIPKLIKAPLNKGEKIGTYTVKLKEKIIAEYPAITLNAVKKGNLLSRISDQIIMYYNVLFGKFGTDKV
jgi:D-alanyl-D-alanine carboxypeptidase (penicillin-binding protein 5/6)